MARRGRGTRLLAGVVTLFASGVLCDQTNNNDVSQRATRSRETPGVPARARPQRGVDTQSDTTGEDEQQQLVDAFNVRARFYMSKVSHSGQHTSICFFEKETKTIRARMHILGPSASKRSCMLAPNSYIRL
jgi:hypothetical protein